MLDYYVATECCVRLTKALYFSEFSPELYYTSSAGVPSTPDPPTLVQATASSLQLSWQKPNTNGGMYTC
jgi:hypothetical protein